MEVTGREAPPCIKTFEEAGLYEAFLNNVKKAHYDKPTPVQKFSIPIVLAGRDLMACAQTGSGKTVRLDIFLVDLKLLLVMNVAEE